MIDKKIYFTYDEELHINSLQSGMKFYEDGLGKLAKIARLLSFPQIKTNQTNNYVHEL